MWGETHSVFVALLSLHALIAPVAGDAACTNGLELTEQQRCGCDAGYFGGGDGELCRPCEGSRDSAIAPCPFFTIAVSSVIPFRPKRGMTKYTEMSTPPRHFQANDRLRIQKMLRNWVI